MKCPKCSRSFYHKTTINKIENFGMCGYCKTGIKQPTQYDQTSLKKTYNIKGKPNGRKIEKHRVRITKKNIDLYCKISQIIRDKPCRSKKLVIANQDSKFVKPVLP